MNHYKTQTEYILDHLWIIPLWIYYKGFVFRCLDGFSLTASRRILLGMTVGLCLAGLLLTRKNHRTGRNVFLDVNAGYGLYTVFAYLKIQRSSVIVWLVSTLILSAIYSALLLFRKIRNKNRAKEILVSRFCRAASGIRTIAVTGMTVLMVSIGLNAVYGNRLIEPSVSPAKQASIAEQTMENNAEMLMLLKEDTWSTLSVQKKLDVLQTVANIEQQNLGLPHELNVGASNLPENLVGYYVDRSHEIVINLDYLLTESSYDMTSAVAHEAYHGLQHRMVDAYDNADDSLKGLYFFREAAQYKKEFGKYAQGDDDYLMYYYQACEENARDYSDYAADKYYSFVNGYEYGFD